MKRILSIGMALLAAMMAAMMFLNACDVEKEPYIQGAEDERYILEFRVDSVYGTVDEDTKMVRLDFPAGTDVTHLTPTIIISNYATIEPKSGVAQDFTNPVYYTVTSLSGSTSQYMVEAVVHDADNEKSILSFRFDALDDSGVIDQIARTISFVLPAGTDVTQLVPTIVVSEGATVDPASGVAQDFTNPVTYTVTAQNGTTAVYTVTVVLEGGEVEPTGKTVLIKDFTGARCVNCPAAAEHAHNLQHQLDEDHIFILSVHAGFQAQPMGSFPNFLTDEGTAWYNNHDSNPLFTVDHVALTEGNTLNDAQIDAPVAEALLEEQSFEIVVGPSYDAATRQLQVQVQAVALNDLDGEFYITVCLVEDHITGWQTIPGGVDADECYLIVYVYDKSQDNKILQTAVKKIK